MRSVYPVWVLSKLIHRTDRPPTIVPFLELELLALDLPPVAYQVIQLGDKWGLLRLCSPDIKRSAKGFLLLLFLGYGLHMMRRIFVMFSYGPWHGGCGKTNRFNFYESNLVKGCHLFITRLCIDIGGRLQMAAYLNIIPRITLFILHA
jgi:hypothetical protein